MWLLIHTVQRHVCHTVGIFPHAYLECGLVDRRALYASNTRTCLTEWRTACVPPHCLPASDSVPPSRSPSLLLVLSLGLFTRTAPTSRSLRLKASHFKRLEQDCRRDRPPGALRPWSSPGCPSDRRVCSNIHVHIPHSTPLRFLSFASLAVRWSKQFVECVVCKMAIASPLIMVYYIVFVSLLRWKYIWWRRSCCAPS